MTELKPCPFCGAAASAWEWNGGARVDCSKWRADAYSVYTHYVGIGARTMEEAIELWNRRAEQPPAQPEIIRCKDCKHWTNNIGDSKLRDNYCNDEAHGFYYQCSEDDYCSFAERRTDEQTVS